MRHARTTSIFALLLAATLVLSPVSAVADPGTGDSSLDTSGAVGAPVLVDPAAPAPKPAPVVVIRSYRTSTDRLLVGSEFELTLSVYNATPRSAGNVVVSLGDTAAAGGTGAPAAGATGGLTVLGTGNAKFLGTLKGLKEDSVTFQVIAGPGTTPGAITVPVTVSFEHEGVRQQVAYTIGLLIDRDAALSLVSAELPASVMTGETFDASFEVGNASGFALSGVTLSVEASGAVVTDGTLFLGTMDAATTESLDVSITPEKAGDLVVAVVVSYRDDFGRPQEFRETRTVTVEDVPEPSDVDPDAEVPEEDTDGNWFVDFFKALFGLGS